MYQSPPPSPVAPRRPLLVLRIALLLLLAPWNCLVLYAGIGGSLRRSRGA